MLDRIADGRTDLVFDYIAAGNPATAEGPHGVRLIQWCAYYGDVSAIRYLLANGESTESLGENFGLSGAAFHGHWRLVQYLLELGADANFVDDGNGETVLHAALCKPLPVFDLVVEVLLAHGADPNVATKAGIETGGFMRDVRTKGEAPLHRAAAFGSERVIRMLLDAGAKVDARDANGDSPLTWASWHHRPNHVLALLCFGEHRIHPAAVESSKDDREYDWRGMEKHLAGRPHFGGDSG